MASNDSLIKLNVWIQLIQFGCSKFLHNFCVQTFTRQSFSFSWMTNFDTVRASVSSGSRGNNNNHVYLNNMKLRCQERVRTLGGLTCSTWFHELLARAAALSRRVARARRDAPTLMHTLYLRVHTDINLQWNQALYYFVAKLMPRKSVYLASHVRWTLIAPRRRGLIHETSEMLHRFVVAVVVARPFCQLVPPGLIHTVPQRWLWWQRVKPKERDETPVALARQRIILTVSTLSFFSVIS